jgi:hypothetical protein
MHRRIRDRAAAGSTYSKKTGKHRLDRGKNQVRRRRVTHQELEAGKTVGKTLPGSLHVAGMDVEAHHSIRRRGRNPRDIG